MVKAKTHKGAKKRFKISGSGAVLFSKQGRKHLLKNKTTKQKRKTRIQGTMFSADRDTVKSMLPYG